MKLPPAAWCPDPTGKHELRYWNGTEWTEHVADAACKPMIRSAAASSATVAAMPGGSATDITIEALDRSTLPSGFEETTSRWRFGAEEHVRHSTRESLVVSPRSQRLPRLPKRPLPHQSRIATEALSGLNVGRTSMPRRGGRQAARLGSCFGVDCNSSSKRVLRLPGVR